jgi:hypothetical protein
MARGERGRTAAEGGMCTITVSAAANCLPI